MEISIQYLAGLFDGEGTITLTHNSRGSYRTPVLSLTSTTFRLVEICKENFGGSISTQKVYQQHFKPSWCWKITNDRALEACRLLQPHIQEPEKLRRINLILRDYKRVTIRNGKYNEQQRVTKLAFEHEFFHPSNTITN